jgi:HlyD family secretion protein
MADPTTPSFLKRRRWWLAGAAGLALVAGFAAWKARPPEVQVLVLQPQPLVRTLQFSARVASTSRVDVGATVTGRVHRVLVREGDAVRAGQPLVELEEDELRAALQQAQASELQAAATLRNAHEELARVQALVARGFVTGSRADDVRRAADVSQAQLGAAQAATGVARARLAQARIVAPTAARVLARQVEPGQIVQAGKALLSLALASPAQLVAPVDERFLAQLQVGQGAAVVADAYPERRFAARVTQLSPDIDAQRGSVDVKFALEGEPPAFLREDLTVSVEVETGRREQALVLPLSALREGDVVWVAREGRLLARPVRLGLRTLQAAEVLQGLAAGDAVVLKAAAGLAPGARVRAQSVQWRPAAGGAPNPGGADVGGAITSAMGR